MSRLEPLGFTQAKVKGATELGRWIEYAIVNPATGENALEQTWAVLNDGLIFGSSCYEE